MAYMCRGESFPSVQHATMLLFQVALIGLQNMGKTVHSVTWGAVVSTRPRKTSRQVTRGAPHILHSQAQRMQRTA